MKTIYQKPFCDVVNVRLEGSCLDGGDIIGGSKGAGEGEEGWAKQNGWFDEEEDTDVRSNSMSIWEED